MKKTVKSRPKPTLEQGKSQVHPRKKQSPPITALQASEQKYRRLFETAQDGILLLDAATGVISDANPVIEEILGYSLVELIGKKLWETAPFKEVSASQAAFLKYQKKSYFRYENLPLETKDGQYRYVDFVSNVYQVGRQKVIQCNIRDITERRQAEDALVESTSRYQELFDNAGLGIFQTAADGRITAVNLEFARMFGYQSPEELIALVGNAADVFADPQRRAEIIRLKAANPGLMRFENLYRRKDGSTFFGSLTVRQATDQAGQALFEGLVEDISERKQAEGALRQSEQRYRTLAEAANDMIFIISRQGRVEYVNEFAARSIGRPMEEIIGKPPADFFSTETSSRQSLNIQQVFKTGQPLYNEGQNSFPGRTTWLGTWLSPIKDKAGEVISILGISRDITERKQAEEKLKENEELFRSFVEQSSEGVILLDEEGVIIEWNHAQAAITGIERQQAIGKPFSDIQYQLLPPDRRSKTSPEFFKQAMQNAFRSGDFPMAFKVIEATISTPDGVTKSILQASFPIKTETGYRVGSLVRDITERKQAEEALRESETLLRESQVSAGLGSYVLDIPAGYWKSSDMLDRLFGIDATYDHTVDGWAALTHPDDQAMMVDYFNNEVVGQGKPFDKEYRIIRQSDQAERWVHGLGRLDFDTRGQPLKMHGTIQDITERKQAQEALAHERNLLRSLIDNVPDSIYVKDTQGRIILVNMAGARRAGLSSPEQMLGKTDFDYFPPELAARYSADDQAVFRSGQPLLQHEEPSLDADGNPKWISTNKVPLQDGQGKIYGLVGMGSDITGIRQAQEKLASQAEELHRRNDELARLYRASGSLISGASLSLPEMAQSIVAVVQQEFGQANCSLLVVSRYSKELHRLAAAGPYTGQVRNKLLTLDGPGLIPQAIRSGVALNAGDVRARPDYLSNWEAARSELAIPLKIGNNVIGVIDVQSSEPQAFSPDDERLMSIFAERAALVLEHARLNAQTDAHIQQLLALRTIDMAISSSFDLSMTLGVLLDQIIRLLGVHAAEILAFNAPTQTFKFSCERGFRNHSLHHMQIKFGAGYAWNLVRERQMIVVPDIRAETDGLQRTPDFSGEQFITYIGIPLLAKGQVKGVMELFQRAPLVLEPEGIAFLEMLAGQAAIAIDNSELFEHLQSSNAELGMAYDSTLEGWANALELRDKETEGHTRRVAELSTRLAQAMGVRDSDILHIYRGALLHDIGKMGVPDSIVLKPGPLTDEEWVIMRRHPQYAFDMLSPIAYLRLALDIPYCHHEKWDGTGYPRGLRGAQIPLSARIFAVVDVWDAITSDRPYRKAWSKEEVIRYIQEQSGRHFDPEVVKAFLAPSFKRE